MKTFRRFLVLPLVLGVEACSSPFSVSEKDADAAGAQLTTAADSTAARGGGNLMGGN